MVKIQLLIVYIKKLFSEYFYKLEIQNKMDECINSIIQRLPFISNDYLLTSYVGKGNYSVVFQAISPRYNDKHFAAKVSALDPCLLSEDGLHEAELEALTQLIHPNIIKVYDYVITTTSNLLYESYKNHQGIDSEPPSDEEILDLINAETPGLLEQESYYLVLILDYCENGTLEEMFGIKQDQIGNNLSPSSNFNFGSSSFANSLNLFSNIVDALSYCHSKGISHGDLKPSNIFVNQYHRAIVADFGLASFYTNSIDIMRGTPYYCAPEIFVEGNSYDPFLADIFALGVTAYQFFTGTLPFSEDELRNGKIDEVEIKVIFPGHEKDYEIQTKKQNDKKSRFSLNLNSSDSGGCLKNDINAFNQSKNTIHTSRANDDFKLYTYRSTVNQNSDQPPKQLSLAPTLAATTAINHPTHPATRIKKRRAVLPDISIEPTSNESHTPPTVIANEGVPHTPLVDHKSLVKPKVSTPTYQAPRVSSFFYGNPKGRSLANFFDKENPEEEEEDEYHDFKSIGEIKKEKARFEVRMSIADLIKKMLTKNPEERPLMAEINYKTKSLITQWYSIDNAQNINHCPSINRVLSVTTSGTNFLLAARHKAAKEKVIQDQHCATARAESPTADPSFILLSTSIHKQNHENILHQQDNQMPQELQQDNSIHDEQSPKQDNDHPNQTDANQEKLLAELDAFYGAQPRDRSKSSFQPNSMSSKPPKINKAQQLLPIIKQPAPRTRSSRRSMKVSSVNLSVFTTKITQKTPNIHSQPNYFLARKGSAGSFDPLRNLSDSETNSGLY